MLFKILEKIGLSLGLLLNSEEKENLAYLKKKSIELSMYGGRMVVGRRGSLSHEFKTKEGENRYWKVVKNRAFCNCDGCKISKDPYQGFQPCHKQDSALNPPKGE